MSNSILSCNIDFRSFPDVKSALDDAFCGSNFLMLSKISEVCGTDTTTIQNWVKRGFVSKASGKKYSRLQAVEIMLLNCLKDALSLDRAAFLIEKAKRTDKADSEIVFSVLVNVLLRADSFNTVDRDGLEGITDDELYSLGISEPALTSIILVMVLACISASYKEKTQNELEKAIG